jgi:16S rRNA (uracil1498-N3)-methyltransferase
VHRFFIPSLDPGDEAAVLPKDEAEHATRVLRLGAGDAISVFDGRGNEFLAEIVAAPGKRDVRVRLQSRIAPPPEPAVPLTLVQAILKGDKMDDVVRDAVMLGVAAIQPVVTTRSETTVAAALKSNRIDRWRRVSLASTKQSRRATLPDIQTPLTLDTYLDEPAPALRLMLVEPGAVPDAEALSGLKDDRPPADAAVLIGPEGGWTEAECAVARLKGCRLVTFGARTLRADAVPIAVVSILQFLWERA